MEDRPMKEFNSFEEWLESTHKTPDWMKKDRESLSKINQNSLQEQTEENPNNENQD